MTPLISKVVIKMKLQVYGSQYILERHHSLS